MQLTPTLSRSTKLFSTLCFKSLQKPAACSPPAQNYASEEINAYLALRDRALAEAEKLPTESTLKRAAIANDFVADCLKPARKPYESQYLTESDAAPERERCQAVTLRLSALRARVAPREREQSLAA